MQINLKQEKNNIKGPKVVQIIIAETSNNMFLSLLDLEGKVLDKISIGEICKRAGLDRKKTSLSSELLGRFIKERLFERQIRHYYLVIGKFYKKLYLVRSAVKGLNTNRLFGHDIEIQKRIAHNGVRKRGPRRK